MKIGMNSEVASTSAGVDKPATTTTTPTATAADAAAKTATAGAKNSPESSAKIALSSTATALLAGMPDEGSFDAEKVGRIAQAISDGKFTVNADAIADKLIANAQEVLSRAQTH